MPLSTFWTIAEYSRTEAAIQEHALLVLACNSLSTNIFCLSTNHAILLYFVNRVWSTGMLLPHWEIMQTKIHHLHYITCYCSIDSRWYLPLCTGSEMCSTFAATWKLFCGGCFDWAEVDRQGHLNQLVIKMGKWQPPPVLRCPNMNGE